MKENIAIILSRDGSERIKNKNTKTFVNGNSLLEILIKKLKNINKFKLIINSTNSKESSHQSSLLDVETHQRSEKFSSNNASSIDATQEVIKDYLITDKNIFLFQCTSPFITEKTILNFVNRFSKCNDDIVYTTGHISKEDIWTKDSQRIFKNEQRRQQKREGFFIENSAIYKIPLKNGKLIFDLEKFNFFEISFLEGFDINTSIDWELAKLIYKLIKDKKYL